MKRITIDIYDKGVLQGLVEINSEEYCFSYSFTELGGGMECNFDGHTDEYNELLFYLRQIEDIARQIERYDLAVNKK